MPNTNQQKLMLGSVNFFKFEVPEALPNLFGQQKVAVHDFSGGTRIAQQLGSFPFPEIEWRGIFFNGDAISGGGLSTAIQRASLLNAYRVTGEVQTLIWGPFQYDVIVHEFEIIGKLAQELEYRIKLIPTFDRTTTSNTAAPSITAEAAVFDANQGVTKATTSTVGLLLPPAILGAATLITQATTAAVISSNGSVSNIPQSTQSTLQTQIAALQVTLQPIVNGSNYGQATAASVLSANLFALSTTLNINQSAPLATIVVTNPNLPQLASQYYNDASFWPLIASANNLQDILPIGVFTLIIPQINTQSAFIPVS